MHSLLTYVTLFLAGSLFHTATAQSWKSVQAAKGITLSLPAGTDIDRDDHGMEAEISLSRMGTLYLYTELIDRNDFKTEYLPTYREEGLEFKTLHPERNPGLAKRPGIPAFYVLVKDEEETMLSLWLEYDGYTMLNLEFSMYQGEGNWPLGMKFIGKVISGISTTISPDPALVYADREILKPLSLSADQELKVKGMLAGKVDLKAFALTAASEDSYSFNTSPVIAPLAGGGLVMAWRDNKGTSHLVKLGPGLEQEGREQRYPNTRIPALIQDGHGFAGLFLSGYDDKPGTIDRTTVRSFDAAGRQRFSTVILEAGELDQKGEQKTDNTWGESQLVYDNGTYAVFLSTMRHFGPKSGIHQGDMLRLLDDEGNLIKYEDYDALRGWHWGASHSFSKSATFQNNSLSLITVGDAYPRALYYNQIHDPAGEYKRSDHELLEFPGKSGDNYVFDTQIGGLVRDGEYDLILYSTRLHKLAGPPGRTAPLKLYLMRVGKDGRVAKKPLLSGTSKKEFNEKLIPYGRYNLAIWSETNPEASDEDLTYQDRYALINSNGRILDGPHPLPTWFVKQVKRGKSVTFYKRKHSGSKPVQLENGTVIWARYLPDRKNIEIMSIRP